MAADPLFSIVIPTRNRAHLLRWALRSAVAQDHHDFEVIVSNNDSADSTRQVVEEVRDGRVRYLETGRTLSMPDHWDFLIGHARGEYVRLLCDDDALLPGSIAFDADFFERNPEYDAIIQQGAVYVHPSAPPGAEPNTLEVPLPGASHNRDPDPEECLRRIAAGSPASDVPTLLNGSVRRRCLEEIRKEAGRIFPPPSPDYSFATLFILMRRRWRNSGEVQWLWGRSRASIGTMSLSGRNAVFDAFDRELRAQSQSPMAVAPVKSHLIPTFVSFSARQAAELLGARFDFDLSRHFLEQFRALETCERGKGFSPERRIIEEALASIAEPERRDILDLLRREGIRGTTPGDRAIYLVERSKAWIKSRLRDVVESRPGLARWKWRLRSPERMAPDRIVLRGGSKGFSNIFEAALRYREISEDFLSRNGHRHVPEPSIA